MSAAPMRSRVGTNAGNGEQRPPGPLKRYVAIWDYDGTYHDEMSINRGNILLVAEIFDDGWMRGLRLSDLEIGFFPGNHVKEDESPIFRLPKLTDVNWGEISIGFSNSSFRSRAALEIYTSEEVYLKYIKILDEKIVKPLVQKDNGIIKPDECPPVFSTTKSLIGLSESLVVDFKSRMEGWDENQTKIGDVFMSMGQHFKLFVNYAVQHKLGDQILNKIRTQEKFRTWLEKTVVTECEGIALDALLIRPIERVVKYRQLLESLVKYTPEDHPDCVPVKDALEMMLLIAEQCNENVRKAENELKLLSISRRFPEDYVGIVKYVKPPPDIMKKKFRTGTISRKDKKLVAEQMAAQERASTNTMTCRSFFESEHKRLFVKEGILQKTKSDFTDPSERYFILCSDVLLIAEKLGKSWKKLKLKERVCLVHTWVTDAFVFETRVPEKGFVLGTPQKTYCLLASSEEEKQSWFSELHRCVLAQKQLFKKLLTHLNIPDEVYYSYETKAKVDYLGGMQDELSFKTGDDIQVLGIKSEETGKWKPGLYSQQESFDPSSEWHFGATKNSIGWFPMQCVTGDKQPLEFAVSPTELTETKMITVLSLKQRMIELTRRQIPPQLENRRTAKVILGQGNSKILIIPPACSIEQVIRMYFRVIPGDAQLAWSLIEESQDGSVSRLLDVNENPGLVLDLWGKCREKMYFHLRRTVINTTTDSET